MQKISIPSPCSEDWNKMTPTEKGAFCQKCSLEVIDFTNQTPEEIRETLKFRMGQKTCGHIHPVQLHLANSNFHVWENQSPKILLSKFLYACLITFGVTLFTGCESPAVTGEIEPQNMNGGVEVLTGDNVYSCPPDSALLNDTGVVEGEMMIDGQSE